MTKHYPTILTGATREEIQTNFIEMLQSFTRTMQEPETKKCRYCETLTPVMDLNTKGICETCEADDGGREYEND